jgi:hypothetical protein
MWWLSAVLGASRGEFVRRIDLWNMEHRKLCRTHNALTL